MRNVAPYGRNAPWSAIPFTIAPMPGPRTPKWGVAPPNPDGAPRVGPAGAALPPFATPGGAGGARAPRPPAERLAVRLGGPFLRRRALSDRGSREDDRGTALLRDRPAERRLHLPAVVAVDPLHVPAVRFEPEPHVLAERERRGTLDRDVIVIV